MAKVVIIATAIDKNPSGAGYAVGNEVAISLIDGLTDDQAGKAVTAISAAGTDQVQVKAVQIAD